MVSVLYLFFGFGQEQPQVSIPPIYVTVNTTQANQTSSTSNATAISYALCRQWFFQNCAAVQEASHTIWRSIKDHIAEHKMSYILYIIVGGYAGLIMYLQRIEYFLTNQCAWHSWTDNIPLEAFYSLDRQLLGERLCNAIQKRYFDQHNPMNRITPIVNFFTDITQEKKSIHHYRIILSWLERCGVTRLPCIYLPSKQTLVQAKKHLLFLEQIATEWCLYGNATELFQGGTTKTRH
jgi:hypothetical protein